MRIRITRDAGTLKAGIEQDVPDTLAAELLRYGYAELTVPAVGGPGFDPGSDVLVPEAIDHPAPEVPPRPAPKPGSPEAVGRGRLRQKEEGA
jgi:hypothetical protein